MQNNKKLIILIVVIIAGAGIFWTSGIFRKQGVEIKQNLPEESGEAKELIVDQSPATTTKPVVAGVIKTTQEVLGAPMIDSCKNEIKADILSIGLKKVFIDYIGGTFFASTESAKKYLIEKGYTNNAGHGTRDLDESKSTDLVVAIIGLQMSYFEEIDGRQSMVIVGITQPIVCVAGNIAPKSKTFLNVTIRDEESLRSAIYAKDKENRATTTPSGTSE